MATPDCWTRSVESPTGIYVRVYEPTLGGVLHIAIRGPGLEPLRQSLRHRDKDRAEAQARAELLRLERRVAPARPEPPPGSLTLRGLFSRYPREARHRLDGSLKTEAYLRHGELVGELLMRHFGEDFEVRRLTRNRMLEFIVRRRSGELTDRRSVGVNTVHRDIGILKAGLRWACEQVDEDEPLLERNPLQGMQFPREPDPKRPLVDDETIARLLSVAPEVHGFLAVMLHIAVTTGRRRGAICQLRYNDLDFERKLIRWRAASDKARKTRVVPMPDALVPELLAFRRAHPGIGEQYLLPHPRQKRRPGQAVTPHLASYWLTRAYRLAGVPKPDGGLWHPFRRKWVTDRADLPLKALAATGGWDDAPTMLRSYMHPDEDQLRSVINYRKPGRPRGPARESNAQ